MSAESAARKRSGSILHPEKTRRKGAGARTELDFKEKTYIRFVDHALGSAAGAPPRHYNSAVRSVFV